LIAVCVAVVFTSMTTSDAADGVDSLEPYSLILTAALGAAVMVTANDLVVSFLGIEILSISLYVLAASDRRRSASQEAGLKYFVLGGFSSAFLLYGIALVYGTTGQTSLNGVATVLSSEITVPRNDAMLLAGVALLLVGFAFKVSLVPFHSWTPDVYHGAPTHVTGFMASLGKIAAIVAVVRLFVVAFSSRADDWRPAAFVLAVLTLVVGSVLAIVQTDVKRMLAYSSVSHAGFMLVGLEAAGHLDSPAAGDGVSSSLIYVVLYSVLAVGSFAAVSVVTRGTTAPTRATGAASAGTSLDAFNGLAKTNPVFALGFTVLLLAQAGVPLTSGFVAKFGVIRAAVSTESYVLAVLAMVSAVIAAYLYLRIMVSMWLAEPSSNAPPSVTLAGRVTLATAVAITLVLGVVPKYLLRLSDSLASLAR
jgi:NADH-quinone oxidoreductase subunit N